MNMMYQPANSFHESHHFPYYIVSPNFSQKSSGPRMLHCLCHMLNELGYEAYITADVCSPWLRTPQLTREVSDRHKATGRFPIAVYPEVARGNPLNVPVVARWILNKAGHLGGDAQFHPDELLFYWDEWVLNGEKNADRLYLPSVDTRIFNNHGVRPEEREGFCYYAHKYLHFGGKIEDRITAGGTSLCQDIPRTAEEIAAILRRSKVLYCYEPSNIITEAYICGCPTILVDSEYLRPFNLGRHGIEQIPEAEIDFSHIPSIPVSPEELKAKLTVDEPDIRRALANFTVKTQAAARAHAALRQSPEYRLKEAIEAFHGNDLENAANGLAPLLDALPENPLPPAYLAFICAAQGLGKEAGEFFGRVQELAPGRADFKAGLGESFLKAGHPDLAAEYLQEAVTEQPEMLAAYPALAQSLNLTGRSEIAVALLKGAAAMPSAARTTIQRTLLEILAQQGNIAEFANACLRYSDDISGNLLAVRCLARFEESGERMVEALTGIQAQLAHLFGDAEMDCENARPSDQPLKIAFMLSDFSREQQLGQLAALLRYLPAEQFITVLIVNAPDFGNDDAVQDCLLMVDKTLLIHGQNDFAALENINAYALDVLVDLDSYDPAERLSLFVQARAGLKLLWGEAPMPPLAPNCMPLRGIRVADDDMLPGIALPEMGEYYALPDIPIVARERSAAGTVFGCLTPAIRIGPDGWRLFAGVLLAVPDSCLVINLKDLGDSAREFIGRQFENAGVAATRLRFVHARTAEELCRHWENVQIGLAPPVDAGDLALPACLWMGKPYIALAAGLPWSHRPAALLQCAGAAAWIADTPENYVALAGQTPPAPDAAFRQRMQSAHLNDPVAFAQGFAASIAAAMQDTPARPISS